jgi:hypothetical protein
LSLSMYVARALSICFFHGIGSWSGREREIGNGNEGDKW